VLVDSQRSLQPTEAEHQGGRRRFVPALTRTTLILGALYIVAVGLLFASGVREFADETDNLLGGVLITRGYRLYVDYFSSHMPLPYYLAALGSALGASQLHEFRLFTNVLLVATTLGITAALRTRLPITVLGIWATLTIFSHVLQFGEMLTAGSVAAFGVVSAGMLFYATPGLRFTTAQAIGLSAAVFVAIQSSLLTVYPLAVLAAMFLGVRVWAARKDGDVAQHVRDTLELALIVLAPHALVLLGMALTGTLSEFVYDAYLFNQAYYSQYLMNPSVVGMLHDWEAQYRTYLLLSLQAPLSVQGCLVLINIVGALVVLRTRGLVVAAAYYLFIGLTHVRNDSMYYLASYFSLALSLNWAIHVWLRNHVSTRFTGGERVGVRRVAQHTPEYRFELAASVLIVALASVFVLQVARTYNLARPPVRNPAEMQAIQAVRDITEPHEQIFVAPYDPYVYLAAERAPASVFSFYFPWQAIDPRSEGKLLADLRANRPPVVIVHADELVNDRWPVRDYGTRLLEQLAIEYAPLDPNSPALRDMLVRADRLQAARQRLSIN
jgi:hypothetical protein